MPWIVKRYRRDAHVELTIGESEFRIVHTDGRETDHELYVEDEFDSGHYDEDYEKPNLDAWKSSAQGIAQSMNEADSIAETSGLATSYPIEIKVIPGRWRVQNTVTQDFEYLTRNGDIANIQYVKWRVYLLSPYGKEETVAKGEWSIDSDDSDSYQVAQKKSERLFEITLEAQEKLAKIGAHQIPFG